LPKVYPSRREVLRIGALPLVGLGLSELLQAKSERETSNGFGKAKRCIILFMWGGPAHQDTWDLKPDAPAEYRGDFKSIPTTIPGYRICEHLPLQAANGQAGNHPIHEPSDVNHITSAALLLTGKTCRRKDRRGDDWPSYGAMLAKRPGQEATAAIRPMMPPSRQGPASSNRFTARTPAGSGRSIIRCASTTASKPGFKVENLNCTPISIANGRRSPELLRSFDRQIDRRKRASIYRQPGRITSALRSAFISSSRRRIRPEPRAVVDPRTLCA
jgi:hypothetical protein